MANIGRPAVVLGLFLFAVSVAVTDINYAKIRSSSLPIEHKIEACSCPINPSSRKVLPGKAQRALGYNADAEAIPPPRPQAEVRPSLPPQAKAQRRRRLQAETRPPSPPLQAEAHGNPPTPTTEEQKHQAAVLQEFDKTMVKLIGDLITVAPLILPL